MSTAYPPSTPPRLSFSEPEPEPQMNARFTATPVDSPRFTFRNRAAASPGTYASRRTPRSSWGSRAASFTMEDGLSPRSPRMCMHGATCVKYGCTFTHPPCRPRDCPAGENCLKVKCMLHHPRSRPIPQYKATPDCRYGVNCTKTACPFNHPVAPSPRPSLDKEVGPAYSGYQVGQEVEAQCGEDEEWKPATVRRIRGAKLTIQFSESDELVDLPRTRVRDPNDPDKENAVTAAEPLFCQEVLPSSKTLVRVCMHGIACVKYGCTFAHPPGRPADCPDGENCKEVKCALHHPRTRPIAQYKPAPANLMSANAVSLMSASAPEMATPRPAVMSPELEELHTKKLAAIECEDYMAAQNIKVQMIKLVKVEKLRRQKQTAVENEDFLLAMELKGKLAEAQKAYDADYNAESTT